jgi:hypothetical protein
MIVTHQEIMAILQNGEFSLDTKKLTHDAPLRRIGLDSLDASFLSECSRKVWYCNFR